MASPHGILVLAEPGEERLASISLELVGAGRRLADAAGEPLFAVLAGLDAQAQELLAAGVDRVYLLPAPAPTGYLLETMLPAVEQVVRAASPRAMLLGHTACGKDLAPRLAVRLGVGLVTDACALAYDAAAGEVVASKPIFGGLAIAEQVPLGAPQLVTVRPKSQEPAEPQPGRGGEIVRFEPDLAGVAPRSRVVERVRERATAKRLEDAEVVVAGGRGVGGPEGFRYLEELAEVLGGVVGASRVAVDSGWVPSELQIGLTGKITSPKLYVAVGISGAMQHMAGCANARTIVAINTDPTAPIFEKAHLGIVGDFRQILPALTAACRALRER
ncbi:MAG TPA: electron transfer flavoprotein subunit alpha/FixB family protein [Chloroflexota bacterium]|nr:electron transfer flavoprotein subunit alpha/FixB family protein [Chloroflexota bacterium]